MLDGRGSRVRIDFGRLSSSNAPFPAGESTGVARCHAANDRVFRHPVVNPHSCLLYFRHFHTGETLTVMHRWSLHSVLLVRQAHSLNHRHDVTNMDSPGYHS